MDNQNTELKTDLFEDLSDEQLQTVVGGAGTVSSTGQGLVSGAGQTLGIGLQGLLNGLSAFNNSENGYLANTIAPILNQVSA